MYLSILEFNICMEIWKVGVQRDIEEKRKTEAEIKMKRQAKGRRFR
jgi:hypothetical protein